MMGGFQFVLVWVCYLIEGIKFAVRVRFTSSLVRVGALLLSYCFFQTRFSLWRHRACSLLPRIFRAAVFFFYCILLRSKLVK